MGTEIIVESCESILGCKLNEKTEMIQKLKGLWLKFSEKYSYKKSFTLLHKNKRRNYESKIFSCGAML